ncbi:MAG: hypothetical protein WB992_05595 [Bryobacteraceae bacterium]
MKFFKSKQPKQPVVAYTTEPAHALLFTPSAKYREVTKPKQVGYVLYSPPRRGHIRLTKQERLAGYLPGFTPICAEVRNASLEIIGAGNSRVPGGESLLEIQSKADARNQTRARRLLEEVKVEVKGSRVRLFNPAHDKNCRCLTEFTIVCPKERAMKVRGVYSAVRLSDLTGGVDVETTHARITIMNAGPVVHARVREGIIDYSGDQGSVRLFAGWELNLKFTSQVFQGDVDAEAEGPVRVLIPEGFTSCFEASVAKDAAFICRADIESQITHRERAGRVIYRFGQGTAIVRLVSRKGPIVIDNDAGASEKVETNAFSPPQQLTSSAAAPAN